MGCLGNAQQTPRSQFREFIPPPDHFRVHKLPESDIRQWTASRFEMPWFKDWMQSWEDKYNEKYKGITTNGDVQTDLYHLNSAPTYPSKIAVAMVKAAERLLIAANPEERKAMKYPLDAAEWRGWSNPEIVFKENGLRLEFQSAPIIEATHGLLRASMSPAGYEKAKGCMEVNHFLGKLVNGSKVLNRHSYWISMFGEPSFTKPWGWQLFGHHLCLNCLIVDSQQVFTPIFMGAEPNVIDEGPYSGLTLFTKQEALAMSLMSSLPAQVRQETIISASVDPEHVPEWRFHRADQRHLGGAFQDNRVIPYEGQFVTEFPQNQQEILLELIRATLDYLPEESLEARTSEIQAHWHETHFAWIGGWSEVDPFYFKIQSPVVLIEFDHHSGVFLSNKLARPFHIHTLVRTPNGNDYGKELVRQWLKTQQK